jgi:hypothetical protein
MTVFLTVAAVTDRAMLLFPSYFWDLNCHHLHTFLVFGPNFLILSSCNNYVRRSDLKLETVRVIVIDLFSLE